MIVTLSRISLVASSGPGLDPWLPHLNSFWSSAGLVRTRFFPPWKREPDGEETPVLGWWVQHQNGMPLA